MASEVVAHCRRLGCASQSVRELGFGMGLRRGREGREEGSEDASVLRWPDLVLSAKVTV